MITDHHLVLRLRINEAIHLLPQYAFMACTGTDLLSLLCDLKRRDVLQGLNIDGYY